MEDLDFDAFAWWDTRKQQAIKPFAIIKGDLKRAHVNWPLVRELAKEAQGGNDDGMAARDIALLLWLVCNDGVKP